MSWDELKTLFSKHPFEKYKELITLTENLNDTSLKAFVCHVINKVLQDYEKKKKGGKHDKWQASTQWADADIKWLLKFHVAFDKIFTQWIEWLQTYKQIQYGWNNNKKNVDELIKTLQSNTALIEQSNKTLDKYLKNEERKPLYLYHVPMNFDRQFTVNYLQDLKKRGRYWVEHDSLDKDMLAELKERIWLLLQYMIDNTPIVPDQFINDLNCFIKKYCNKTNTKLKDPNRAIPFSEEKLAKIEKNLNIIISTKKV